MNKILIIISATFIGAILFYPTASNSNSFGSPGGKTGSPADIGNCTGCHSSAVQGQGAQITTNIPSAGYIPGDTYTITATIFLGLGGTDPKGFEVTCEENTNNTKTGSFGLIDAVTTQFTNNNNAVTHTASGNNLSSWSFNWVAPPAGTGDITFYGAFIEASYPIGNNQGDLYNIAEESFSEATLNSTINLSENSISFNSVTKIIKSKNNEELSIYNIEGKLVLSSNNRTTSLSHLSKGIYVIKSANSNEKILIY